MTEIAPLHVSRCYGRFWKCYYHRYEQRFKVQLMMMQYCHFLKGFMCVSKQPVHIMNLLF